MTNEEYENIIRGLTHLRERYLLYVDQNAPPVINFIAGFNFACSLLKIPYLKDDGTYQEVLSERGWTSEAPGPWYQMADKGMSEQEISEEWISIHLEAWHKRYNKNSS